MENITEQLAKNVDMGPHFRESDSEAGHRNMHF